METLEMTVDFFDDASREDDLGGGRIYSALVKQAILKRLNHADADLDKVRIGQAEIFPVGGAVIADTSDKTSIPMQIVCPVNFEENFLSRISSRTGATLLTCTVEDVIQCLISTMRSISQPESWNDFITWFNDNYREYYNEAIASANLQIISLDGGSYTGIVNQMGQLNRMADLFTWMLSCMTQEFKAERSEEIIADNNIEKIGMSFKMTNVGGTFAALYGSTVTLHFYVRL